MFYPDINEMYDEAMERCDGPYGDFEHSSSPPKKRRTLLENFEIIKESEKAFLVKHEDFDEPAWLPKSQISTDSRGMLIPTWLFRKKMLGDYDVT